jgi:DeoR family fructose operon transcriptional repressor
MYAEERQDAIATMIASHRRVSVSEAAETFGVTTETVRRDLAVLERQGLIHRVHGGAVPANALTTLEPAVADRAKSAAGQKDRIARAALILLPGQGGSILLDAGTTTAQLARQLPQDLDLTLVTNDPAIAVRVLGLPNVDLHLLGGRVRATSHAAVGPATTASLANLRVDVSFLGTNALSVEHGLSTPDAEEAAVKAAMIAAGRRVVVLADSTKLGEENLVRFGQLHQIDALVTDEGISDQDAAALEALEIDVVIA